MSGRGGCYEGPGGQELYGDGREVDPISNKPVSTETAAPTGGPNGELYLSDPAANDLRNLSSMQRETTEVEGRISSAPTGGQDGSKSDAHNAELNLGNQHRSDVLAGGPDTAKRQEVTGAALEPGSAEAFYEANPDDPRWNYFAAWLNTEIFAFAEAYASKLRAEVERLTLDIAADDRDFTTVAQEAGVSEHTREAIVKRIRELKARVALKASEDTK